MAGRSIAETVEFALLAPKDVLGSISNRGRVRIAVPLGGFAAISAGKKIGDTDLHTVSVLLSGDEDAENNC